MKYTGVKVLFMFFVVLFSGFRLAAQSDSAQKYRISVIMPFCAKDLAENPAHKNASIGAACRSYYEGFLLALDSFRHSEVPIEVKVLDTNKDSLTFKKILDRKEVQNSDLIIGPVLKEGNEMMMAFCDKYHIYHISPFLTLTKSKIENPYLISVYPDLNSYADFMLEQLKVSGYSDANIVVLAGKDNNDKVLAARLIALKSKYPGFTIKQLDLAKYTEYKTYYKYSKPNKVIICSENEFLVGSALRHLSDTTQFLDLEVYGTRKWLEFKAPNIPQMEHLQVKIFTPYFMDYRDSANYIFIEKFRERYFTDPDEYAVNGYEQGVFFISQMLENHGDLSKLTRKGRNKPLSNWYCVRQKPDGKSLQNSLLNILYFENGVMKRY